MKKTAHYRKVIWIGGADNVLSDVLQECFDGVPQRVAPVFEYGDNMECMVAVRRPINDPTFFHFVLFEAGAPAGVIANRVRAAVPRAGAVPVNEVDPPDGQEFVKGQLFCVAHENDLVWIAHGAQLRENKVAQFLYRLIWAHHEEEDAASFFLQPMVDEEVFERAFAEGIAEIDLGLGGFQATLEMLQDGGGLPDQGIFGQLMNVLRSRATREELEAAEQVKSRISLRPGRNWDAPFVTELLSKIATDVVAHQQDEFTIVTKGGFRVTRDKMAIHKTYELEGNDRVLDPFLVEARIREFFEDLQDLEVLG